MTLKRFGQNFLVGLDIGSAWVKVAVAGCRGGKPSLRAIFKEPSAGLRKGVVVDPAFATGAVAKTLHRVKEVSKSALKVIYVNIGTHQAKSQPSRGIVAVSRADNEIYEDDIERVLKASTAMVNLAPNRLLIHNVTREYLVDGVGDIVDPLGLSGNRLEVQSLIIDAFAPHIKSVMRVVELGGGRIGGLVFDPLVSSRAALSKTQKDLGVVLLDIGFGTTGMSVYEENKLIDATIFPVGAANVTNDLAVGLKIPVEMAEKVKLACGYALAKEIGHKETVELAKFSPENKGMVSRRFIAEIMELRLAEILGFVNTKLKLLGKQAGLPGGVVLVGGGAKIPGLTELVKQELRLSAQMGSTHREEWGESSDFPETFEDPEFTGAMGLALWGADREYGGGGAVTSSGFRRIMRYFLP